MIKKNDYGYYEVTNKPSQDELNSFYKNKYYQDENISSYRHNYTSEEITYFQNQIAQKHQYLVDNGVIQKKQQYTLLDVGCGEGFTLNYFKKLGWNVTGLDFSGYGLQMFNPQCFESLIVGDIYQNLEKLIQDNQQYDIIWLDNVLEHVIDPLILLQKLHQISSKVGILIIEVPNDFSTIQKYLYNKGTLDKQNWVVIPDHLSYFNKQGLINLCQSGNWISLDIIADFPIDWFLFNEYSNYYTDRTKGKAAHQTRIEIDNILHDISPKKTIQLYKSLADLGMGRQIIGFFKKKDS